MTKEDVTGLRYILSICVRTPVFIQFGVSCLQTGVGAKWAKIM